MKKPKTIKYRTIMRSPSDKWILPDKLNKKKQRIRIKKDLNKIYA